MLIARQVAKVKSINGPSAMPDWDFARALKEPLDVLMVPGGGGIWPLLDDEADPKGVAALLDWMQGGAPLIGDRNAGLLRIEDRLVRMAVPIVFGRHRSDFGDRPAGQVAPNGYVVVRYSKTSPTLDARRPLTRGIVAVSRVGVALMAAGSSPSC